MRNIVVRQLQRREISTGVHLAVFVEPYLSAVLDGRKTIESRFSIHRRPPYHCVEPDDLILLKRSGGPIVGVALAQEIQFYQLSPGVLAQIRKRFSKELYAQDDEFWSCRKDKRYATLIQLHCTTQVSPLPFDKRDRQGWVTLDRHVTNGDRLDL